MPSQPAAAMLRRRWARWLLAVGATVLQPATSSAHTLYVFARAEGRTIRGEVYYRGRQPARGVSVKAIDPAGSEIGRTETDIEGQFRLQARYRCDHRLLAATADGHGAEYTLTAAQLPRDLPPRPGAPEAGPREADAPGPKTDDHPATGPRQEQIADVCRQLVELRRQLNQYEQRVRIRDVLGGLGYILGIAAVAFYFLSVRRNEPNRRP